MVGGVRHISCQTSTLTVNHLTASAQFTIVSVTAVYVPPATGTKGPWSVLYWNIVGMQQAAHTFSLLLEIFTSQMWKQLHHYVNGRRGERRRQIWLPPTLRMLSEHSPPPTSCLQLSSQTCYANACIQALLIRGKPTANQVKVSGQWRRRRPGDVFKAAATGKDHPNTEESMLERGPAAFGGRLPGSGTAPHPLTFLTSGFLCDTVVHSYISYYCTCRFLQCTYIFDHCTRHVHFKSLYFQNYRWLYI